MANPWNMFDNNMNPVSVVLYIGKHVFNTYKYCVKWFLHPCIRLTLDYLKIHFNFKVLFVGKHKNISVLQETECDHYLFSLFLFPILHHHLGFRKCNTYMIVQSFAQNGSAKKI